jgi:hypothetical protein
MNNTVFANHVEQLILSDNLADAGSDLLTFLKQFNAQNDLPVAKDLQQQLVGHIQTLRDLTHQMRQKSISAKDAAAVEKNLWVAFHHINNQVRNLSDFETTDKPEQAGYMPIYKGKPQTWREAGWLPMLIAGAIVGVAFTIGIHYNNIRIKDKKTAEQAAIDAKNGVLNRATEGFAALKLLEEKTTTLADGTVSFKITKVNATDSTVTITLNCLNKSTTALQNVNYLLVDNAAKDKQIPSVKTTDNLVNIPAESATSKTGDMAQIIHFNCAIGESRSFLLVCKFTMPDSPTEKILGVPLQLR